MPICLRFPVLQNYRYFKCRRNSLRIVASMWVNSLDVCVLPVVVCKKQRKRKIGSAFRKVLILRWGLLTDWLSNFGLYKWCFRVFGSAFAVARCDALIFMNVWAFFFRPIEAGCHLHKPRLRLCAWEQEMKCNLDMRIECVWISIDFLLLANDSQMTACFAVNNVQKFSFDWLYLMAFFSAYLGWIIISCMCCKVKIFVFQLE